MTTVHSRNPKYHSMALESLLGVQAAHKCVVKSYKGQDQWVTFYNLGDRYVTLTENRVKLTLTLTVVTEKAFTASLQEWGAKVEAEKVVTPTPEPQVPAAK